MFPHTHIRVRREAWIDFLIMINYGLFYYSFGDVNTIHDGGIGLEGEGT